MALEGIDGNTFGAYQYRPRAVLISTSGIFPVYLLKPWVNLYNIYVYIHIYIYIYMYLSLLPWRQLW